MKRLALTVERSAAVSAAVGAGGSVTRGVLTIGLALWASGVAAQTHPCDVTPVSVDTKVPFGAGVCWSGLDTDGNPAGALTALRVLVDGVVIFTVPNPSPTGPPSAAGESFYLVPGLSAPKGPHSLTVVVVNEVNESVPSDPYAFRIIGAAPSKPSKARVEPR